MNYSNYTFETIRYFLMCHVNNKTFFHFDMLEISVPFKKNLLKIVSLL